MADPGPTTGVPAPPTVGMIMTRRVVTASPEDTLADVKRIFESRGFHHLIVVENRQFLGLVSDRDLFKSLSPFIGRKSEREQDVNSMLRKVHQIMRRRVPTCREGTSIAEAGRMMLEQRVSCIPVVNDAGRCVGILTSHDLLSWCMVRCGGSPDRCAIPKAA